MERKRGHCNCYLSIGFNAFLWIEGYDHTGNNYRHNQDNRQHKNPVFDKKCWMFWTRFNQTSGVDCMLLCDSQSVIEKKWLHILSIRKAHKDGNKFSTSTQMGPS